MDKTPYVSRRSALKGAGALAMGLTALELASPLSATPARAAVQPNATPSDIQFDIGAVSSPPQTSDTGVPFAMPPVHTMFITARLQRTPTLSDQTELNRVLSTLESNYLWSAAQLITMVSYGIPYFQRLPGGLNGSLVASRMPRLLSNNSRFALEEAVPSPTDVSPGNPGITKLRYNVPVAIERNDLMFVLRSDNPSILTDVINWFNGSNMLAGHPNVTSPRFGGLLTFTSTRHMFVQIGMPQAVAQQNHLPFANFIQHQSPMWMGFADQQTNASGPAPICTFAGNSSARLTNAVAGDYFDNGAIQHLAHDIIDMLQWFDMASPTSTPDTDGVFTERVQYMFHSPAMNPGRSDQFTDGGGPAFLPNQFRGAGYAAQTAQGIGTEDNEHRVGHLSTLQRSSRASDGTPIHARMDGPGFDSMDVPDGSNQPKLQFSIFVPTADFFTTMRRNTAAQDLSAQFNILQTDNGLERFITATRRQNYLIPPRRHRAFPLVELA
ncbi:MAG TPA: hypothetical protein VJT31_30295 [Rugosimonospora sp.]|nr:hypothetical protein [Rugosimonospora sp.]